jgi:serine protease AprX
MKKIVLVVILFPFVVILPQEKYFIYFKDKGKNVSLLKSSPDYSRALEKISPRALARRQKVMNSDSLVTFEDLPVDEKYISQLKSIGVKIVNELDWFNAVSAYLDENLRNQAAKLPFVKKIVPVKVLSFRNSQPLYNRLAKSGNAAEQDYGNSYDQLALSDIPLVQSKGITGSGIIIGVLDTGFDWKFHEALKNADVLDEYDFVFHDSVTANQSQDVPGQDSHGTYVFSVISGYKDSILIGASYGSSFILAKTEDIRSETHVEEDNYAAALEWMENLGVDVTSSSLGYNEFTSGTSYTYADMNGHTTIVTQAAELAFQRGVVTITAAGNEGNKSWYYIIAPADGYNTIAVGAVYFDNIIVPFSSRGPTYDGRIKPDVVAMGVDVYGASRNGINLYTYGSGTSSATPIAGGIAGLLLSAFPYLSNVQVRDIFHETSDNAENPNNERGYGLLSAAKAISFPNLQNINGDYVIHKAFIDSFSVIDAKLHYSTDNSNFTDIDLNAENAYAFKAPLPAFSLNQEVNFYFTFTDENGTVHRDPDGRNYKMRYGDMNISLNIDLSSPADYVLSHNYPNPFNSYTSINFVSAGNFPAELIIFDALGRKVKTLFHGTAIAGTNRTTWNGWTDSGYEAASGIYFYTLNLNGNLYTGKMVYLK